MGKQDRKTVRRFFSKTTISSRQKTITLDENETRHLRTVLRHSIGDRICVFDGSVGNEYICQVKSFNGSNAIVTILQPASSDTEAKINICLAFSVPKTQKSDLIIRKSTELGVKEIIPIYSTRSVVKPSAANRSSNKIERWQRICLESAKQSNRTVVPTVDRILHWNDFIADGQKRSFDLKIFANENRDDKQVVPLIKALKKHPDARDILATIGPEGGFEPEEAEQLLDAGFIGVSLGKRILRAETAACALLSALFFFYDW